MKKYYYKYKRLSNLGVIKVTDNYYTDEFVKNNKEKFTNISLHEDDMPSDYIKIESSRTTFEDLK